MTTESTVTTEITPPPKPPLYRDVRVLRWVFQLAVVGIVVAVLAWLYDNAIASLEAANLPTGFDFLDRPARFAIPGLPDSADFTIQEAYIAGFMNTLRVIAVGLPMCTVLGVIIGIGRLSENLVVRVAATIYVEVFRNVPVLLWIFVTYLVIILQNLPDITEDVTPLDAFVISNRGIGIPWLNADSSTWIFVGSLGAALLGVVLALAWRRRYNERTGNPPRGALYGGLAFAVVVFIGNIAAGNALALDPAKIDGRLISGGMNVFPPYVGLTVALGLYTASHVAEIVRGAIQAVHKGQTEAANALALTGYQRYRYVVLPQAFRIMIPPLASQYLNLAKNSSLAVGVSFVELTSIFQRVSNNATPALQAIMVLMVGYLIISLSVSLVTNLFNRSLALESR